MPAIVEVEVGEMFSLDIVRRDSRPVRPNGSVALCLHRVGQMAGNGIQAPSALDNRVQNRILSIEKSSSVVQRRIFTALFPIMSATHTFQFP